MVIIFLKIAAITSRATIITTTAKPSAIAKSRILFLLYLCHCLLLALDSPAPFLVQAARKGGGKKGGGGGGGSSSSQPQTIESIKILQ